MNVKKLLVNKSILSTVNTAVHDVVTEIGKKITKHIEFSKEVTERESHPQALMSFETQPETAERPIRKRIISPPPPIGGARHFLGISRKDEENVDSEKSDFTHRQFLQARVIKKAPARDVSEKLEIRKEGFSEPASEREEVYKAELKLDTPNAIHAKLPDKTKMMCLIDIGATETLISEAGIQESGYLRDKERITLKHPKKVNTL